jgi:hypothetical protein
MKKLIIEMLTKTPDYTCGNIAYVENSTGIAVYSARGEHGVFFAPHLAAMFDGIGVGCYCRHNELTNRVEMQINHN